jgi:hypothetical protein
MIEAHYIRDVNGTVSRVEERADMAQVEARPLPSFALKDGMQLYRFSVVGNIETAAEPRA